MDQRNPEIITKFYMWLSAPQPNIDAITSLIIKIATRNSQPRADLALYIDYCERVILRAYQIETECKEKRDALPAGDCDIEEELISAKRKQINFEESCALAIWEVFENRIALAQRIINQRNLPAQRALGNARIHTSEKIEDELTVHQTASRMRHDLYTKGMARTEDVVKVLGDPAKSISVSLLPPKH